MSYPTDRLSTKEDVMHECPGKNCTAQVQGAMSTDETITIPKSTYLEYLESHLELEALRAAGVDNWEGYSEVDHGAIEDALEGAKAALGVLPPPQKPKTLQERAEERARILAAQCGCRSELTHLGIARVQIELEDQDAEH
jgi:hypothetical protein